MRRQSSPGLCACGCGQTTKGYSRFVPGHNPASYTIPEPLEDRFWRYVERTDGCWLWRGTRDRHGYGRFFVTKRGGPRQVFAHRFSYALHHGSIAAGLAVCHHCDTPECVRPEHLFLATQAENLRDMWAKGRASPPPH